MRRSWRRGKGWHFPGASSFSYERASAAWGGFSLSRLVLPFRQKMLQKPGKTGDACLHAGACFSWVLLGRSPSAGGNAFFPPAGTARRRGRARQRSLGRLSLSRLVLPSGRKCCKSQGKQAMHACMQAPVFPGFYRAKPFSRRKCIFSSGWHGAAAGESAPAQLFGIYTNFFFCDVQNFCCQAQIAQNPPGISGRFYICRKNVL